MMDSFQRNKEEIIKILLMLLEEWPKKKVFLLCGKVLSQTAVDPQL
jgi:hypothetical protein